MAIEASRWVTYGEAAALLGLSGEATKRLSLRQGWPRRVGPAGGALVAVPDGLDAGSSAFDEGDAGQGDAHSLLAFLEVHVERLTEELAEAAHGDARRALRGRKPAHRSGQGSGPRGAGRGGAGAVGGDQGRARRDRGRVGRAAQAVAGARALGLPRVPAAVAAAGVLSGVAVTSPAAPRTPTGRSRPAVLSKTAYR